MRKAPLDSKGVLFVVSTSHMDWHWHSTFEQYYGMGNSADGHLPVRYIFDQLVSLLPDPTYRYNLAEVAWLQRYAEDNPGCLSALAGRPGFLSFLGGGITSPDSLDSNGEAFIRNYLVGRAYLKKMGLGALLTDVCWVPDDFGSDPQLPVVLKAMGMKGVGFARIPGYEPRSGGGWYYLPVDGSIPLAAQLAQSGVTFRWAAADGATVMAQYMLTSWTNPGYGVVWNQAGDTASQTATQLNQFVTQNHFPAWGTRWPLLPVNQPGSIMMAPCGGDFSVPSGALGEGVQLYNQQYYPQTGNGVYAVMGTFTEFLETMAVRAATLQTLSGWNAADNGFDPSSYWTGHFANYVALKIHQQRAVNRLLAAETLSVLLRGCSYLSGFTLSTLDRSINAAWEALVPSTHHDFITGTAPTSIYHQEQLPLSELALRQSEAALATAMSLLSQSVAATEGEVAYVVWNPSGSDRKVGTTLEIPPDERLRGMASYSLAGGEGARFPIQVLADGSFLVQVPSMPSMGYTCLYFSSRAPNQTIEAPLQKPPDDDDYYLSNGVAQIAVSKGKTSGFALDSIVALATGAELTSGPCNSIQVYSEGSSGNPYQMGNELSAEGFVLDSSPSYTIESGSIVESGPYRWRFQGTMSNGKSKLTVEYLLELGEPLVRVRVTGNAAPDAATSVVTSWSVAGAATNPPGMSYGTANHWNGPDFTPYWQGPIFRATHDYLTLDDPQGGGAPPVAAVYHEGMRAWALYQGALMGILFRNTNDNGGRGAQNSDTDTHTQQFAFRLPGVGAPASCQPLQEALAFQQPLVAARVRRVPGMAVMKAPGSLASISGGAVIRMARAQPGSGGVATTTTLGVEPAPFSFVLRIYQPTNQSAGPWTLSVPFIGAQSKYPPSVSLVTALEEPLQNLPAPPDGSGTIQLATLDTLTTVRIQSYGPLITPTDP